MPSVNNSAPVTAIGPVARPLPPSVTAAPAPRMAGDDYARPSVFGAVTTVNAIGRSLVTAAPASTGAISGLFNVIKAGIKANVVVAASLSLVTNGYDFMRGRSNIKQFLGLTAADLAAYTAIGTGATAAAAALAPLIPGVGAMLLPVVGVAIAATLGIGASLAYGKFGHNTIKEALK